MSIPEDIYEDTVQALEQHIRVTAATRTLLQKPPFKFLHKIVRLLHEKYPWFAANLFADHVWDEESFRENHDKAMQWKRRKSWVATLLLYVKYVMKHDECLANPSNVIRGESVHETLRFIQILALVAPDKELPWDEARLQTLEHIHHHATQVKSKTQQTRQNDTFENENSSGKEERQGNSSMGLLATTTQEQHEETISSTRRQQLRSDTSSTQRPQSARARLSKQDTVRFGHSKDTVFQLLGLADNEDSKTGRQEMQTQKKKDHIILQNHSYASEYGLLGNSDKYHERNGQRQRGTSSGSNRNIALEDSTRGIARPSTASGALGGVCQMPMKPLTPRDSLQYDNVLLSVLSDNRFGSNSPEDLLKLAEGGETEQIIRLLGFPKDGTIYSELVSVHRGVAYEFDIGYKGLEGYTALHYSSVRCHEDVVDLLLRAGADPHVINDDGEVALHLAAWKGCEIAVEHLADFMGNVDTINKLKQTPLFYALEGGHFDVASVLVRLGASLDAEDEIGDTAKELCEDYPEKFRQLKQLSQNRNCFIEKQPLRIWSYVFSFLLEDEVNNTRIVCSKFMRAASYYKSVLRKRNPSVVSHGGIRGKSKQTMVPGLMNSWFLS